MPDLINAKELKEAMKDIPEWDVEKKQIERTFEFDDFMEAIDFVNAVAEIADEDDHHPDIEIREARVKIILTTHSKGGITDLDIEQAEKINSLVE